MDDQRQEKREEILLMTDAIMRLGKIGFQKIPLASLKEARRAMEGALVATADDYLV